MSDYQGRDEALQVADAANVLANAIEKEINYDAIEALISEVEVRLHRVKTRTENHKMSILRPSA